jgi:IS30 family transposase
LADNDDKEESEMEEIDETLDLDIFLCNITKPNPKQSNPNKNRFIRQLQKIKISLHMTLGTGSQKMSMNY